MAKNQLKGIKKYESKRRKEHCTRCERKKKLQYGCSLCDDCILDLLEEGTSVEEWELLNE